MLYSNSGSLFTITSQTMFQSIPKQAWINLSLIPAIFFYSISGFSVFRVSYRFFEASPIISKLLAKALFSTSFSIKSSISIFWLCCFRNSISSSMCLIRTSSCFTPDNLPLNEGADILVQSPGCDQVHLFSKQVFKVE